MMVQGYYTSPFTVDNRTYLANTLTLFYIFWGNIECAMEDM